MMVMMMVVMKVMVRVMKGMVVMMKGVGADRWSSLPCSAGFSHPVHRR